jgi:putative NIF3 family GTP cyclohydrolase 1 type 2
MSEHDYHESREAGIHMFAGGHHATEKFGIQALMKKIQDTYPDLQCEYLDSENPA